MADNPINFSNPVAAKQAGETISTSQEQLLAEWGRDAPETFIAKHGVDTYSDIAGQMGLARVHAQESKAANSKTLAGRVGDILTGALGGAVQGITDTGALAAGMLGADKVAETLARASSKVQDVVKNNTSISGQAQESIFNDLQQVAQEKHEAEYQQDIASGMGELEAKIRREAKNFGSAAKNAGSSGYYENVIASGFGSIYSGGIVSGGIRKGASLVGKGIAKATPDLAARSMSAYAGANPIVKKVVDASPWMVSMGLQEGGNAYSGLLTEELDKTPDQLLTESPQFQRSYAQFRKQGMSDVEAKIAAKEEYDDEVRAAALEAGMQTGAAAMVLNVLTKNLEKPFANLGKAGMRKSAGRFTGEMLSEPVEEAGTEAAGQLAQNRAVQKRLNETQDVGEGVGSASALGALGGFGVSGVRGVASFAPEAVHTAVDTGIEKIKDYKNKKAAVTVDTFIAQADAQKDTLVQAVGEDDALKPILTVSDDLASIADAVYGNVGKDGKRAAVEHSGASIMDANTKLEQAQAKIEAINTDSLPKGEQKAQILKAKTDALKQLVSAGTALKNQALKLGDKVLTELGDSAPTTQKQVDDLATYLFYVMLETPDKTSEVVSKLTNAQKQAVLTKPKTNKTIQKTLNSLLDPVNAQKDTYSKISEDGFNQLGLVEHWHNLLQDPETTDAPLEFVNSIRMDGDHYISFKRGEDRFTLPTELNNRFREVYNNDSLPQEEQNAQLIALLEEAIPEIDKLLSTETPGNTKVDPDRASKLLGVLKERRNMFYDPDTGTVQRYDTKENQEAFKAKYPAAEGKMVPLRRIFKSWGAQNPVASIRELIADPAKLTELFKSNQLTNAEALLGVLNGRVPAPADLDQDFPSEKGSLASKIVAWLHPKSLYMKAFNANIDEALIKAKGNLPETLQEMFFKDGKPTEEIKGILAIAGLNWTSVLGVYAHQINAEEAAKRGINLDIQAPDFNTESGVLAPAAIQNLTSSIKKVMGVSKSNKISEGEFNKMLGALAVETASALLNGGVFEVSKIDFIKPDGEIASIDSYTPTKNFMGMFKQKADVLLHVIDPTLKNSWSTEPFEPNTKITHTDENVSSKAKKAISKGNNMPAFFNTRTIEEFDKLFPAQEDGSIDATLSYIFGEPDPDDRLGTSRQAYLTKQGQNTTWNLGVNFIKEVVAGNPGKAIRDIKVYFNTEAYRNAREGMGGAVNPQTNHYARQALRFTKHNTPVDLTSEENLKAWKIIVAQNLGESINKKDFSKYEKSIHKVLDFVDNYSAPKKQTGRVEYVKALVEAFNKEFSKEGYVITEKNLATLFELEDFSKQKKADALSKFNSELYLEIDGINDGPSYINALLALAGSAFNEGFLRRSAKTGIFFGVDTTSQEAMTANSEAARLLGTKGKDFHNETKEDVVKNYLLRVIAYNNRPDGSPVDTQQTKAAKKLNKALLTLFKAVGWVEGNIDEALALKELPEKYPITFSRLISKELSTIIPYGSGVHGSSTHVMNLLSVELGKQISLVLQNYNQALNTHLNSGEDFETAASFDISKVDSMTSGGIPLKDVMQALGLLLSTEVNKTDSGYSMDEFLVDTAQLDVEKINESKRAEFFYEDLPPAHSEANMQSTSVEKGTGLLTIDGKYEEKNKPTDKSVPYRDRSIRNFKLTLQGIDHLADVTQILFGAPAHAAVTEVIGTDGMKAAKISTIVSSISTAIVKGLQKKFLIDANKISLEDLSPKEAAELKKVTHKVDSIYRLPGGATIVVGKDKVVDSTEDAYTNKSTGISYTPSITSRDSSGVSASPLLVQGYGDATMAMSLLIDKGDSVSFGQIFDGMNIQLQNIAEMAEAANKATSEAHKQKIIGALLKHTKKLNDNLIDLKLATDASGDFEAILQVVKNLADGKLVDGQIPASVSNQEVEATDEILSLLNGFNRDIKFIPHPADAREDRRVNHKNTQAQYLIPLLRNFLTELEATALNEELNHRALETLPKTTHHMSGPTVTYKEGTPLTLKEADALFEKVNKIVGGEGYSDWNTMVSAYLNTLVDGYMSDPEFAKQYSPEVIKAWKKLTKRDAGNSGYTSMFNLDAKAAIDEAFLGKHPEVTRANPEKSVLVPRKNIKQALRHLGASKNPILENLVTKITSNIPSDLKITLVASYTDLPMEAKERWDVKAKNGLQQGLFAYVNGMPNIYILDQRNQLNIDHEANLRLLAHEVIHAALANKLNLYYHPDKKANITITSAETKAIQNLESLVDNFVSDYETGKIDMLMAPQLVEDFYNKLMDTKSPEERLDEALAYIFSNEQLFSIFSNYKPSKKVTHKRNLINLLGDIVRAAKEVWYRLIGVVTGSPMEKALDFDPTNKKQLKNIDLHAISLYGANTMALLTNPETKDNIPPFDKYPKIVNRTRKAEALRYRAISKGMDPDAVDGITKRIMDTVLYRIRALGSPFEMAAATGEATKEGFKQVTRAKNQIQAYSDNLVNFTKNLVPNPEAFGQAFSQMIDPDSITSQDRSAITRIHTNFINHNSPYVFLPSQDPTVSTREEQDASIELYNLISEGTPPSFFGEGTLLPPVIPKHFIKPVLLMALAVSNPSIFEHVKKINIPVSNNKVTLTKPIEALTEIANRMADRWLAQEYGGVTLQEAAKKAEKNAAEVKHADQPKFSPTKLFNALNKAVGLTFIYPLRFFDKEAYQKGMAIVDSLPENSADIYYAITEKLRDLTLNHVGPTLATFLKEFYGRLPSNAAIEGLLKKIKAFYDKDRKLDVTLFVKMVEDAFKTKPTLATKHYLFRVMGKADVSGLSFAQFKSIAEDEKNLQKFISETEAKLASLQPDHVDFYKDKALQLAKYVANTADAGHLLLTNALAIIDMVGTKDQTSLSENSREYFYTKKLITLYALNELTPGDKLQLKELMAEESAGLETVFNQMVELRNKEMERVTADPTYSSAARANKYNIMHGWLPLGHQPSGRYALVPQNQVAKLKKKGYNVLGEYKASNLDPSDTMVRVYNPIPLENAFQEGVIQGINKTAYGFQIENGSRGYAIGETITDPKAYSQISNNYIRETSGNNVIPLFTEAGTFEGFERSIPTEDRILLEQSADIISGLGTWKIRQTREGVADSFNDEAFDIAVSEWENASAKQKQDQFIDVFNTSDKQIQRAVAHMPASAVKEARKRFRGNHFYIKKDVIWSYIGQERMSLTDMWENNFMLPTKVENSIVKILELIFPSGKAQYYTGLFEKGLMGLTSFARDTIIIRSGIVPFMNAFFNIIILNSTLGIPFTDIYRLYKLNLQDTYQFQRLVEEEKKYEFEKANTRDPGKKEKLQKLIEENKKTRKNLTIYPMIARGEYSTISAMGAEIEEVEVGKQHASDLANALFSKLPAGNKVKKGLSEALMLKGTESYKTMAEFTNLGDWLAKTTTFRYFVEQSKTNPDNTTTPEEARAMASILFVDYDQFSGREFEWANRVGLTWFMTFAMRMIPAAVFSIIRNPARVILNAGIASTSGLVDSPLLTMMPTKIASGDWLYNVGFDRIFRGLTLHPINTILGI